MIHTRWLFLFFPNTLLVLICTGPSTVSTTTLLAQQSSTMCSDAGPQSLCYRSHTGFASSVFKN